MSGVPGRGRGRGRGSGDKDDEKKKADEKRKADEKKKADEQHRKEAGQGQRPIPQGNFAVTSSGKFGAPKAPPSYMTSSGKFGAPNAAPSYEGERKNISVESAFATASSVYKSKAGPPDYAHGPNKAAVDPFYNLSQGSIETGAKLKPGRPRRRAATGNAQPQGPQLGPAYPTAPSIPQTRDTSHTHSFQQPPQQQLAPISSISNASQAPTRARTREIPPNRADESRRPPVPLAVMPQIDNPTTTPARSRTWDTSYTDASSFQQPPRQQPPTFVSHYPLAGPDTQQRPPTHAFQQPPPRLVPHHTQEYNPHHTQEYNPHHTQEYNPHYTQEYTPHHTSSYDSQQGPYYHDAQQSEYDMQPPHAEYDGAPRGSNMDYLASLDQRRDKRERDEHTRWERDRAARVVYPEPPPRRQTDPSSDQYAAVTQPLENLYITPRPIGQPTYQATPMGATTANPSGRPRHSPPSEDDDARPARRRNTGDTEGKQPPRKSNMRSLLHHTPSPPSQN